MRSRAGSQKQNKQQRIKQTNKNDLSVSKTQVFIHWVSMPHKREHVLLLLPHPILEIWLETSWCGSELDTPQEMARGD